MLYSMKQTCEKTGLTYDALKFYCNEGLVPNVKRDKNNYRLFDDNDIGWLKSLICLKKCGMSVKDMKIYLELCLKGSISIPKRKKILNNQRNNLVKQVRELEDSIDFIDRKQKLYDDILDGKVKYQSYLINDDK